MLTEFMCLVPSSTNALIKERGEIFMKPLNSRKSAKFVDLEKSVLPL